MDKLVIGHEDVKMSLLLGILSREHIYIEGPPGTAKTMLAEIISKAAQLKFFFYQLHRDTRLSELIGDLVISKETLESGELIRQKIVKGGILTSEICLLDDISRAPGESLNVLLRILNERKFFEEPIPLLTAIGTSNPTADEYYNEPLDPANLDRFVLQIKAQGLSYGRKWEQAKEVIKLYTDRPLEYDVPIRVSKEVFDEYYERISSVTITPEVQDGIANFVSTLIDDYGLNESNSLITDRTFFVKSLKIMRSHALIYDRETCTLEDLKALKYMTAFRVPEEIFQRLYEIIEEAISKKKTNKDTPSKLEQQTSEFDKDLPGEQPEEKPGQDKEKPSDPLSEARKTFLQALQELQENIQNETDKMVPPTDQGNPSENTGRQIGDSEPGDEEEQQAPQKIYASKSPHPGDEDEYWIGGRRNYSSADNVKVIMKVLEGTIQRSMAFDATHPGGLPRRWKRMNHFEEMEDVDPFEGMFWAQYTTPSLPRVHKREKETLGGEIAILRDVSTSMMGVYSEWSSSVVRGVIELAKAKKMKVGYVEFNHRSYMYKRNSKFFTRDYHWMLELASKNECSGNTNYEDALKGALSEFKGRGLRNKHILFITDGIPTSGDCDVVNERGRAKKLGVCVHSIFIGSKNYPKILERISRETSGAQFIASRGKDGKIRIEKKEKKFFIPKVQKPRVDPFTNAFSR
ncbi:AAA family ATPase [Desulfobacterota bacterium AH_259_B03_O07]|nr:AAA family ATPase [Desulfobacterota bacterium AH_259_B03_O07]